MSYIDANKALAHLNRLAEWQQGRKPAPVTVEWDLSNRCSLGCQFCHFAHTHTKGPWAQRDRALPVLFDSGGDLADVGLVRRGLKEMAEFGVRAVVWSGGGEPTLHPSWRDIVSHAAQLGLRQGMYTLGGHLDESSAAHLAGHASWVVVSLDACDAESYAAEKGVDARRFEMACNGIRWLVQAAGTVVGASFLIHEGNWRRMRSMLELSRNLGASYAMFRPAILTSPDSPATCLDDRNWINDAMPMIYAMATEPRVECDAGRFEKYRDWRGRDYHTCYGIRMNATVTPDGRVWVCPQRRGLGGDSYVGDLRKESFAELWKRHVGCWTDFSDCRAMCRLHLMNETLAKVYEPHEHAEFL